MAVWLQTRGADMSFTVVADDRTLEVRASLKNEDELTALIQVLVHRSARGSLAERYALIQSDDGEPFFKKESQNDRPDVPAV